MSEQAWQPVSDTVGRSEDYAAMVRKVHAYDALESRAAALEAALEQSIEIGSGWMDRALEAEALLREQSGGTQ